MRKFYDILSKFLKWLLLLISREVIENTSIDLGLDTWDYYEEVEVYEQNKNPLDLSIDEIQLSVRSYNCLKRANIYTVKEIAEHSQTWLQKNVRNLGRKSVEEIAETLTELGVHIVEYTEEEAVEKAIEDGKPKILALEQINSLIGLANVKERVKDISAHCVIQKLKNEVCESDYQIIPNMIFFGNAGTGKTTVAKLVAQAFCEMGLMKRGHLVCVTRADLVAEYTGQSAIKTKKAFMSALDGVFFVDEAYSLYHKRESEHAGDTFSQEVIDTLTALMTEYAGRCCVIFAGYYDEMNYMLEHANPGLRERFPFKIYFEDYTTTELSEIFCMEAAKQKLQFSDECRAILYSSLDFIRESKSEFFANGREATNFLQEVILLQERRLFELQKSGLCLTKDELLTLYTSDFQKAFEARRIAIPSSSKYSIGFRGVEAA